MDSADTDRSFACFAESAARPLIERFVAVACPPSERWHAVSTLNVLAVFVAATTRADGERLRWQAFEPDRLVEAALDVQAGEHTAFLCELLDLSAAFYGFLREQGEVSTTDARRIRARLVTLALGLRAERHS